MARGGKTFTSGFYLLLARTKRSCDSSRVQMVILVVMKMMVTIITLLLSIVSFICVIVYLQRPAPRSRQVAAALLSVLVFAVCFLEHAL